MDQTQARVRSVGVFEGRPHNLGGGVHIVDADGHHRNAHWRRLPPVCRHHDHRSTGEGGDPVRRGERGGFTIACVSTLDDDQACVDAPGDHGGNHGSMTELGAHRQVIVTQFTLKGRRRLSQHGGADPMLPLVGHP